MEAIRGTPLSAKNVWTTAAISPPVPQPIQLPFANSAFHNVPDFWAQGGANTCHAPFPACGAYTHFPDSGNGIENQFRATDQLHGADLLGRARLDLLQFAAPVMPSTSISSPLALQSLPHDLIRPPMDLPSLALGQNVSPPLASPLPTDLHVDLQPQFNELEYREALKNVLVENVSLHKQLEVAAVSPCSSEKEDSLRQTLVAQQRENSLLTDEIAQLRREKDDWAKEKCGLLRELQQYQSSVTQHEATEKQLRSRNEQLFQETQQLALALQQLTNRNLALLEEVETHKRSKHRSRQDSSRAEDRSGEETGEQTSSPAKLEQALQHAEQRAHDLKKENNETMEVLKQLTEQTQALLKENARLSACYTRSEQRVKELSTLIAPSENGSDSLLDDSHFDAIIDCTESVHFSPEDDLSASSVAASSNAASVCLDCVDVAASSAVDEAEAAAVKPDGTFLLVEEGDTVDAIGGAGAEDLFYSSRASSTAVDSVVTEEVIRSTAEATAVADHADDHAPANDLDDEY